MSGKWQQWYPHMIDAWQGSSTIQTFSDTAYRGFHNLIMEQFQSPDGMLPDDDTQLARLSRLGARWPQVATEVRFAFKTNGAGKIYSQTQYELWAKAHTRHDEYIVRNEQIRARRAAKRAEFSGENSAQTENGLSREEKRSEIGNKKEEIGNKKRKDMCAVASTAPARDADGVPITLPLVSGAGWPVPAELCLQWASAFPAVNILDQLLRMRAWLTANPKNRKTPNGIQRFAVSWLSRAQDSARTEGSGLNRGANRPVSDVPQTAWTPEAMAAREKQLEKEERTAYGMWLQMPDKYKAENPWHGQVFPEMELSEVKR